jgi:hypothetical protein
VLSEDEAARTKLYGQRDDVVGVVRLDNQQNYSRVRVQGIGRQNKLNIGIGATFYEAPEGIDASVFDLDQKRVELAKEKRRTLTTLDFVRLINNQHLTRTGELWWIKILVDNIPQLAHHKEHLNILFRTRVAKNPLPKKPTKLHTLASSSKNEAVLTELKDAVLDILEQTGQTKENFKRRKFPIGGDGMTYEKILGLQELLQFEHSEFDSLEILEPLLEWWHTQWTNSSRACETHWGVPLSPDPSTLGNSAHRIGRKAPPNLKKVDYYYSMDLLDVVLTARMLDCWRLVMPRPRNMPNI